VVSKSDGFAEQQDGAAPGVRFCVEDEHAVDGTGQPVDLHGAFAFQREAVVRQGNPPECEATRRPHVPVRCLVEVVRADATDGASDTMTTKSGPGHGRPDPALSVIMSERRQLINLAYRLLGSLADGEDAVQETYARWYAMSPQEQDAIASPGAWLTKVAPRQDMSPVSGRRCSRCSLIVRRLQGLLSSKPGDALRAPSGIWHQPILRAPSIQ
jgi:hypothetical protein